MGGKKRGKRVEKDPASPKLLPKDPKTHVPKTLNLTQETRKRSFPLLPYRSHTKAAPPFIQALHSPKIPTLLHLHSGDLLRLLRYAIGC